MFNHKQQTARITEEPLTLEEEYEAQRINAMPEPLQRLSLLHHMDQFEAVPTYIDRYRPAQKHEGREA